MFLAYMNREELQGILNQLDQALYNHIQWHNALIRILVCHLSVNIQDLKSQAYRDCLFGQWYYNGAPKKLGAHPTFIAIGAAHRHMHQLATELLLCLEVGNTIEPRKYDYFANSIERLQLEISSLKQEIEILLYTRDPLTGTINRTNMLPTLREIQEMGKRQSQVCSIAMTDLDFFKSVNDKYGHPAGDIVLKSVARFLSDHLRPYDKLFRYGGEEFLICMQDTDIQTAYERTEELRKNLEKKPINIGRKTPVHITASFGLAELDSDSNPESCIERADKAMYEAKKKGRNCAHIWTE